MEGSDLYNPGPSAPRDPALSDEAQQVKDVVKNVGVLELPAPRKRKLIELLGNSVRTDEGLCDDFTRNVFHLGKLTVFADFDKLSREGRARVLLEIDDNVCFSDRRLTPPSHFLTFFALFGDKAV